MKKLKVLSLFSGIGAFEKALTNIGIDYELIGFSEIDPYAIKAYTAIHNVDESLNYGDISKIKAEDIPDFDLLTYGFPCTDVSVAGRQRGLTEGSGTSSSLLWEAMRIAKEKKPKFMIAENVKNLIGKKFIGDFEQWLKQLDDLSYNTYYAVLDAKNFHTPQSRSRVFVVSIRKDMDNGTFRFPVGHDSGIRLKDIMEEQVDSKYYLSESVQKRFHFLDKENPNIIGSTKPDFRTIGQRDLVYKKDGIMGCLVATDYKQPKQVMEAMYTLNQIKHSEEIGAHATDKDKDLYVRIRKLTPKEGFRLMKFTDEDFKKAQSQGISDTQLYKQAGNSIVVSVLEAIFENLLLDKQYI